MVAKYEDEEPCGSEFSKIAVLSLTMQPYK